MNRTPRISPTAPWDLLQRGLAGSFRARARGLLGNEFSLLGPGDDEFARLEMRGPSGAGIRAGTSQTEIGRSGPFGSRYRMTTDGAVVLLAKPGSQKGGLGIFCNGETYQKTTNLLRNTATARLITETSENAGAEVRLEGGLAGRSYRARFPAGDGGALAVAVFLLFHNVALRRQAF